MKNSYRVIGLMSGTSLDGLDIAFCHFRRENNRWQFELLASKSIDYDTSFRETLKNTVALSAEELLILNNGYGAWLGEQVAAFISENNISADFVSSHGHTVFHQPGRGLTYQIGSGQHLANACGLKTICDFRTNDVALGGQGAPFVPIGDALLFGDYSFCLNLGGISNISFDENGKRLAFDISPVNMLLNHLCQKIGKAYDFNGNIARSGLLHEDLLAQLNCLKFYTQKPPKSLGYEWFVKEVLPLVDNLKLPAEDLLHTSVHHIAHQIAIVVNQHSTRENNLLATGGGAKNSFLIETLQQKLKNTKVVVPAQEIIDFKEAIVFGLMGVLREGGEINVLSSVTGAKKDSSSGVVYLPA